MQPNEPRLGTSITNESSRMNQLIDGPWPELNLIEFHPPFYLESLEVVDDAVEDGVAPRLHGDVIQRLGKSWRNCGIRKKKKIQKESDEIHKKKKKIDQKINKGKSVSISLSTKLNQINVIETRFYLQRPRSSSIPSLTLSFHHNLPSNPQQVISISAHNTEWLSCRSSTSNAHLDQFYIAPNVCLCVCACVFFWENNAMYYWYYCRIRHAVKCAGINQWDLVIIIYSMPRHMRPLLFILILLFLSLLWSGSSYFFYCIYILRKRERESGSKRRGREREVGRLECYISSKAGSWRRLNRDDYNGALKSAATFG